MKPSVLFAALGLVAFGASAQEVGHVISSVPVVQQVAVPRQVCGPSYVQAQPQTSGGGGLLGGLAGAGLGSTIGQGNGAIAAGVVGAVAGALIGNSIEANNMRAQQAAIPNCTTETSYENRTVGYDVTYEYAGRQYTTRMASDPGATIALQVTPAAGVVSQGGPVVAPPVEIAPAAPVAVAPVQATVAPQVVVQQAAPVVYPAYGYPAYPVPVYPAYPAYRPYPPVGISLGFVFGGGHHRHWR
jgi:uncharacterized protein YcfJ